MFRSTNVVSESRRPARNLSALLAFGILLLLAQRGPVYTQPAPPPDALQFFKNYFVTGNYVTANVDFGSESGGDGFITGVINVNDPGEVVPPNADVVAALLYWQTITSSNPAAPAPQPYPTSGLMFRDADISGIAKQVRAEQLNPSLTPCWSGGGGQGAVYTMRVHRADVLRYLPIPTDEDGVPVGKRLVNDADLLAHDFPLHEVRLPDAGVGNQVPQTAGASLVVIYRLPTESLKAVVVYDGLHLKGPNLTPVTQTLRGFYEASAPDPNHPLAAKMTYLVGSGAPNSTERVTFNGSGLSPLNPFIGLNSPSSDRGWDAPTFDVSSYMSGLAGSRQGQAVSLSVNHTNASPYDCLATSAIVLSTTVKDSDFDGLLDVWETGYTSITGQVPFLDPTGVELPALHAMGASPTAQDVFVEVGYMSADEGGETYGPLVGGACIAPACVEDADGHTHLPSQNTLAAAVTVFQNAGPRRNPANPTQQISTPIKLHFDVGGVYPTLANAVPASVARGGEEVPETACVPTTGIPCQFGDHPGTVGWKPGFRRLRDQPFVPAAGGSLVSATEDQCEAAGAACQRRFDENRRHMFRYGLFAHALGIQDPTKAPGTPRSISGVSDAGNGGGDFMVALGRWDNFTGTEFMQASTLVHELGHTMGLRHGGSAPTVTNPAPNCKPNYESVMNYLFQVRGLIATSSSGSSGGGRGGGGGTSGPAPGFPVIDFSRQQLGSLNEGNLGETALTAVTNSPVRYPTRWYAPRVSSYLDVLIGTSPATRHCDGSPILPTEEPALALIGGMVRVDGTYPIGAIDWNATGILGDLPTAPNNKQDINFSGTTNSATKDGVLTGFDDFWNLDLRQTASRRNPAGLSLEVTVEDLASAGDPGYGDPGYGDPGYGDPGYGDPGYGDPGYGDPGYGDPGYGDPGYGDPGYGDPGYGDPGYGGELDVPAAESLGNAPNSLTFQILTANPRGIYLDWTPPHAGSVSEYQVWRAINQISPSNLPAQIGTVTVTDPDTDVTSFIDFSGTTNNVNYAYFVTATVGGKQSGPSNILYPIRR